MTGRNVYTLGETLLDIIFRNAEPEAARPGGAMLNTAISLGRSGDPVHLISEVGSDQPGSLITRFLEENGVSTRYLQRYSDGSTALALAFLNAEGDAEYTFYKNYPRERFIAPLPAPSAKDLVLFGSIYAVTPEVREPVTRFIKSARQAESLVIYDPNFRRPHLHQLERMLPYIMENMAMSDLVRGSDEDFRLIFGTGTFEESYNKVAEAGCRNLIYTCNSNPARALLGGHYLEVPVPQVAVVSTIGAGDSFNAGILHAMLRAGTTRATLNRLTQQEWVQVLTTGVAFAAAVCGHLDNYIPPTFHTR